MSLRPLIFVSTMCLLSPIGVKTSGGSLSNDEWKPFAFLVGPWMGVGSGSPGEGSGYFTFAFDLDSTVLVRKNHSEYPPAAGETQGTVHDDLMIVYRDPNSGGFRAVYFDNEGHVIHYVVSCSSEPLAVTFDSEPGPGRPHYRLLYTQEQSGLVSIEFLIGPPGGELKRYLKGSAQKSVKGK